MPYRDFQHFLQVLEQRGELKRVAEPVSTYLEITEITDRLVKAGFRRHSQAFAALSDEEEVPRRGGREAGREPHESPALLFESPVIAHRLGTPNPRSAVMGQPSIHEGGQRGAAFGAVFDEPTAGAPSSGSLGIPVAINSFASRKRMSLALGVEDFEEHAERLKRLLEPEIPKGKLDALRLIPKLLSELKGIPPKRVGKGICQEVVLYGNEVDLTKLPILTCWPEDGGPFLTLPMVFTFDPETGKRNVGMYRMQLYDKNTLGMHWQMHKTGMRHMEAAGAKGKRIEVAVALGGDPAYTFSAIAPLPPGVDEMLFAGFLRKAGAELVKGKTVDVLVPANAEIVLEGFVDPAERRLEGPFGDHTGYYSLAEDFPVFHCTCLTMRQRPVYPATVVGVPPMEDGWMGKAVERIFLPMIRMSVPEIVDLNLPIEACFHNVAFVSIKKKYPGHAFKAMNAIWGLGGLAFTKFVFVFDEDCDVQDLGEVLFRIGANCDPARDCLHSRGPIDQLDHASLAEGFGGKLGFDCTHKWPGENGFCREWPKRIVMAEDVKKRVNEMWTRLGLG